MNEWVIELISSTYGIFIHVKINMDISMSIWGVNGAPGNIQICISLCKFMQSGPLLALLWVADIVLQLLLKLYLRYNERGCVGIVCEASNGSGQISNSKLERSEGDSQASPNIKIANSCYFHWKSYRIALAEIAWWQSCSWKCTEHCHSLHT